MCSVFADAPATSSNRFLFIIDTSANMLKWDEPVRESVFDLLYSGVRGHMTNGDSFGVWLAGGANDTSASVETWKQKHAVELASRVAVRVKERGTKGKPCLAEALADAKRVASAVGDVTVILVSNGKTPVRGTPFDAELNSQYQEFTQTVRNAQATLNTVLVAQDGEFVAWSVNSPDFLVSMPEIPPRKVRAKPSISAVVEKVTPTNSTALAGILGAPPVIAVSAPPTAPRPMGKSFIITRETVDRERQATRAMAATFDERLGIASNSAQSNAHATIIATNAPLSTPAPVLAEAAQTNGSGGALSQASKIVETPILPAQNTQPAPAPRISNVTVSAALPDTNRATMVVGKSGQSPTKNPGKATMAQALLWASAGAFGCGAFFLLVWIFRRERSDETSLISRAVAMERVREQQ